MSTVSTLTQTIKSGMDSVFTEVGHNEGVESSRPGQLRMFHLRVRNDRFFHRHMEEWLYRNIARYVFSRAKIEQFKRDDDLDLALDRAIKTMRRNGPTDQKGTGNELGEMLVYAFLEGKLNAGKLMSRVEMMADYPRHGVIAESIHMLSGVDEGGRQFSQMVFGTSSIVGDLQDAIDNAFEAIAQIEGHSELDMQLVEKTALERFYDEDEIEYLKGLLIPKPNSSDDYDSAYGLFLGYTLGIDAQRHPREKFVDLVTAKMEHDIHIYAPYIARKIGECGLGNHSFYVYIVPFGDAERDKLEIMTNVMEGAVS